MQNLIRENFDDSTSICQIRQTFPPSKFQLYLFDVTQFLCGLRFLMAELGATANFML